MDVLGSSRPSDQIQEVREEIPSDISESLSKLHLEGSMALAHLGRKNNEPRTGTATDLSSRAESNISNSQITPGRDMISYHVGGNLTMINNYEESMSLIAPAEGENVVSENKRPEFDNEEYDQVPVYRIPVHVNIDYSDIAAGMMIPVPPPCILERDSQHNQIVNKLSSIPNAKVAVLGMGGIGKTTLACSVASDPQIIEAYPRRLFLAFEGCSTPDLAYTSLATAFQVPAQRRSSHQQILLHVLNYLKQEKTLFIIDNFETFWDVSSNRRSAENFLSQLGALPKLAMIVTLRGIQRPGNIRWIKVEPLQTLTHDASKELLSIIIDEEDYPEGDSEYIQKLLDAVAGIPLAITLIGFLLRDGSETAQSLWNQWTRESARAIRVASEIDSDDRLYKLDISLRLSIFGPRMSENTKEVLAAIATLPTGLSMEESWLDELQSLLSSAIRLRDCIRTLRDVSLAILDSSTSPPRLKLLSPVRDFCLNNLPLDNELLRRLIDVYYKNIRKHWQWISSEHYTWVTTELSNLTAMLNHAITLHYVTDDFGWAIHNYTEWRCFLCIQETDIVKRAIDILSEHPKSKAKCLQALGTALSNFSRGEEAIPQLEQALSIHRELEDTFEIGWDLYVLGYAHYCLNDFANAEHHLTEARNLRTETDHKNEGAILQFLADTYLGQDRLAEAESTANEALELCRASNDRRGEINALVTMGRVYSAQSKYDLAVERLTSACETSKVAHDTRGEAYANAELGYVYLDDDKPKQAALHLRLALSLFERAQLNETAKCIRDELENLEPSLNTPEDG